jgi:hypothetical protein
VNNYESSACLKTISNSKDGSESPNFLFQLPFSAIGQFSPVYSTFHVMGGYLKPRTNFLKRAQKGFSELLSVFIEACTNLNFNFLQKRQPSPSTNIYLRTQSFQASKIE